MPIVPDFIPSITSESYAGGKDLTRDSVVELVPVIADITDFDRTMEICGACSTRHLGEQ